MGNKRFGISISTKDKSTKIINGIVQHDTGNVFYMTITEDGSPVDLSDTVEIIFNIKKPDGSEVIDSTGEKLRTIVAEQGQIEFTCDGECVTAVGLHVCTLSFYDTGGAKITTARFDYYVAESLETTDIGSYSSYPIFQQMITAFNEKLTASESMLDQAAQFVNQCVDYTSGNYVTQSEFDYFKDNEAALGSEEILDDEDIVTDILDMFEFTELSLDAAWATGSYVKYALIDSDLIVFIDIAPESDISTGTVVGTLPGGYRPSSGVSLSIDGGTITIGTDGVIQVEPDIVIAANTEIDNIYYGG
jgi:hypothetical protein